MPYGESPSWPLPGHDAAVGVAQRVGLLEGLRDPTIAKEYGTVEKAFGQVQVVRRQDHDRTVLPQAAEACEEDACRGVVQSRKGFVEEHEPRTMDQSAFEGNTLAHASRKASHRIVGSIGQSRMLQGSERGVIRLGDTRQRSEEHEVLARGQLWIKEEIVSENADRCTKRGTSIVEFEGTVADVTRRGPKQRGEDREHCGLARAVRPEKTKHCALQHLEAHVRERAATAEVSREIVNDETVEVDVTD